VGGLAILLGGLTGFVLLGAVLGPSAVWSILEPHKGYVVGACLLVAVGLWDDLHPVRAFHKLLVQLSACMLAVLIDKNVVGDVVISAEYLVLTLGPLAIPFTVLVMLTVTNAINMIDGADGLAGGIMLMAMIVMAKGLTAAGWSAAPLLIGLIGALTAFLIANFPFLPNRPAQVFLGDCGSLLLGFTLAYLAISFSALPYRLFKPSTALWLFFIPVADTIWLYLRRMWFGRAPFAPGRDHLHHFMLERLSPRATAWTLVGLSGLLGAIAYGAERLGVYSYLLIVTWVLAFLAYGLITHAPWKRAWLKGRSEQGAAEIDATACET